MKINFFLIFFLIISIISALDIPELTIDQKKQLMNGETILIEKKLPNAMWPEWTVLRLTDSTPEEVTAVFWNMDFAPKYMPNCLSAHLHSDVNQTINIVEYEIHMPFMLPNEIYAVKNKLVLLDSQKYQVSWKMLYSHYASCCYGTFNVQPYSENHKKTIIIYTNFIVPSSKIAILTRYIAKDQLIKTVESIIHQTESEVKNNPKLLNKQINSLKLATGSQ